MLGEFLEISLSTPDILASIEFYERLGFSHASTGETRKHPYAVLTDGRLYIGLHKHEFASPALTFVLPELNKRIDAFEELGISFEFCNIALDQFNEVGFLDLDGQMVTLLEARTYSPLHASQAKTTLCGYFLEYRLAVRDRDQSARFWEALGFLPLGHTEEPVPYAQAARNDINLGLLQAPRRGAPTLVFAQDDMQGTAELLDARGFDIKETLDGIVLQAPEGTVLSLLRPDETLPDMGVIESDA
jgi:catechol 2,3-dioxygenase-like lactoylglutathione lyase family enzyme